MGLFSDLLKIGGTAVANAYGGPVGGALAGSLLGGLGGGARKVSVPQMDPNLNNQLNLLRQKMADYGNKSVSDRPYDIERKRISADAYRTAQNMGNAAQRSLNRRGMLNSGLASRAMGSAYNTAATQMSTALGNLEQRKISDKERRKQASLSMLENLMSQQLGNDRFGRGLQYQGNLANLQQQNAGDAAYGGLGSAIGGMDWSSILQKLGLQHAPIEVLGQGGTR